MKKLLFLLSTFIIAKPKLTINEKIQNSLIAAAYGDALGRVTEFIPSTEKILKRYPNGIKNFDDFKNNDWNLPAKYKNNKIAPYTDDTAMTILVLKELTSYESREFSTDFMKNILINIGNRFIIDSKKEFGWKAGFRAPGNCCMKYVSLLDKKYKSIFYPQSAGEALSIPLGVIGNAYNISPANGHTGGCGSVMRAYPFGFMPYPDPSHIIKISAEHSKLTHGDYSAQAACAAIAIGVYYALKNKSVEFIVEQMTSAANEYDTATANKIKKAYNYALEIKPLIGNNFDIVDALKNNIQFRNKHDYFFNKFQGWSAQDAIAGVAYTFTLFPKDVENAIYTGVHTQGDSDSIASIAGALVGAYSDNFDSNDSKFKRLEGYKKLCQLAKKV